MPDHLPKSNYPHLREAQRIVWREDCTLSHLARHIAAYLLNRMNEDYDGAYPSVARISADTGLERRSVIRHTQEIIDSGLLARTPGRKGMYTYRLTSMEDLVRALDTKLADWATSYWARHRQATGDSQAPVTPSHRCTPVTATGDSQSP
jgi:Helix-turn-helix domain